MNDYLGKLATFMILAGAVSLIGLLIAVFMIISNPEGFHLSRMILSSLEISEPILSGRLGDQEFALDAAKPLRYVLFGFVGIFLVSMLVSIVNGVLAGGIKLAKYAAENNSDEQAEKIK